LLIGIGILSLTNINALWHIKARSPDALDLLHSAKRPLGTSLKKKNNEQEKNKPIKMVIKKYTHAHVCM
jgi:chorismate-pyruvate lyase